MSALSKLLNYFGLAWCYLRFNLKSHLEYRAAFVSQMFAMFLNDCIWVVFWTAFFTRFPVIQGWGAADVITLWAMAAAGFGIAETVCGNSAQLAALIARGELDSWLLYPRAVLPHLVLGKMIAVAAGDVVFGYAVYIFFVHPDAPHMVLFTLLTFSVALAFVGMNVLAGSLGFIVGNAQPLADQWRFAMITFSTYPASLFDGPVRFLLYSLIPAAFVSYLPIEALHNLSLAFAGYALLGSISLVSIATVIFYWGLSRYESGNLMAMKG
jgi:ABC-2 type transport system permease protein